MSGAGAPKLKVNVIDKSVAIIASQWHEEIMQGLIAGAVKACQEAGAEYEIYRVPGSFELPVAAAKCINRYDVVVALGVVIRGGTPHFDYVCEGVTYGLTKVSVESRKPIGFGVLTCDNEEQARARAGLPGSVEDKGYEAAMAGLSVASW